MDFDYKKYSLENLENWMHDAMSAGEATPQEIYDTIRKVVEENYYTYKHQTSQAYELLALLNGNGQSYEDVMKEKEYYEPSMPPWGHSDLEYGVHYSEEELNAMCDKAASDQEKEQCREYNLREAEYYDKRAKLDATYDEMVSAGYEMTADGFWIKESPKDKVKKWQLPVEIDGPSGEYYFNFPDDLLEAANLKEGDQVEWNDNGDGSYTLRKVADD